jgi:hypothetical protein
MSQNKALAHASVVILLVLLALRGHFGTMPFNGPWTNGAATAISLRLAVHMAELQLRHAAATVGRYITIR